MAEWLRHLGHLIGASWTSTVTSMGTTTLALFLLAVLPFFGSFVWRWYREGRSSMRGHAFRNILGGAIWAVLTWSAIYGWNVIKTVYQDHQNLVTQAKVTIANCDSINNPRDTTIRALHGQIAELQDDSRAHFRLNLLAFNLAPFPDQPNKTLIIFLVELYNTRGRPSVAIGWTLRATLADGQSALGSLYYFRGRLTVSGPGGINTYYESDQMINQTDKTPVIIGSRVPGIVSFALPISRKSLVGGILTLGYTDDIGTPYSIIAPPITSETSAKQGYLLGLKYPEKFKPH